MKWLLSLFLCIAVCVHAELIDDEDEQNPALFHHVNVISGDLNLAFEDTVVQGAKTLPITRVYSSAGALERNDSNLDLRLKDIKDGFIIQGGWSYFPHSHMLIRPSYGKEGFTAYVADKSGSITPFEFAEREGKHKIIMKPKASSSKAYGKISGKNNADKRVLIINVVRGTAKLYLPDGSVMRYEGDDFHAMRIEGAHLINFYRLEHEELPSKHSIYYDYDGKGRLKGVEYKNPQGTKTFSSIKFYNQSHKTPYRFQAHTSDGKEIDYNFTAYKERDYLQTIKNSVGTFHRCEYSPGRSGIGARMNALYFNDQLQFKAFYYRPESSKEEKKIREKPEKKKFWIDKVQTLEAPLGPNGEMIPYAKFSYQPGLTEVRDSHNLLTRYHHSNNHTDLIEYFDEKDRYASSTKFLWQENKMVGKIDLDRSKKPLFSKVFEYDTEGNVTKEVFWGNISGDAVGSYSLQPNGSLTEAESFTRKYAYDPHMNLLLSEEEEGGLSYRYQYKQDTDLLTAKFTCYQDKILIREFLFYDDDHLLIAEITDDGSSPSHQDLTGVTERRIKRYDLDVSSGLQKSISEFYLDLATGQEILLCQINHRHSSQKLVVQEDIIDASGAHRYSIYTDYDAQGHIIRKTTPIGQENTYQYDLLGHLIAAKEVGSLLKKSTYDLAGRVIKTEEIDEANQSKISTFSYDAKGRLLSARDHKGNITRQSYDAFGNCISTEYAQIKDENGTPYAPVIVLSYDERGNLASTSTPRGDTTRTYYTSFRKPYRIIQPDGSETVHTYNKNGTIAKTVHPDGTQERFSYDSFRRITKQEWVSAQGDLLKVETWTYSVFHLLSHIDERGLVTNYSYDGAGRLVEERAGTREKRYEYDALGQLEKIYDAGACHIQVHDVAGRVVEDWIEAQDGTIENKMSFLYDSQNRKVQAKRLTSQGEAEDFFGYDAEGRLSSHTDPLGNKWEFLYSEKSRNDLGQCVLQKTTIDPLGLRQVEQFDALGHLAFKEKQNASGIAVAKEEWFYDKSGNKAKRLSTVYVDEQPTKTHAIAWRHDSCGRLIEEIESGKKVTEYEYDLKGRIVKKTLPSSKYITYAYDGLDRLLEQKSSDGTVHYLYRYDSGTDPTAIEDRIHGASLTRDYNEYGQIVQETTSERLTYAWSYDDIGRCQCFTLPDQSTIEYGYSDLHLTVVKRTRSDGVSYQHSYTLFDPNGHVQNETLIHGIGSIASTRDLLERASTQTSNWHACSIAYGPSGLITQMSNTLFGEKAYAYDALNQIRKEGDKEYHFDSLGNASDSVTGECNELLSTNGVAFAYDEDGNPISKDSDGFRTIYQYDALGRLTSIRTQEGEETLFHYDALSRLVRKESQGKSTLYLHNDTFEVGTISPSGEIQECKILGLGIKGDIGAAIAIEIATSVFAPLHDFNGNIVALIAEDGTVAESYDLNAFGQETNHSSHTVNNPWRFCSKRHEDGLVFFGLRFYDPSIGRWLTPDPAGYAEGPNLYVYVLNSPINRLDLFGLFGEPNGAFDNVRLEIPTRSIVPTFNEVHTFKGTANGVEVDWLVTGGKWTHFNFTPEENKSGMINVFDHIHELVPAKGTFIGLVTMQNGIQTSLEEAKSMLQSVAETLPRGTLIISLYSPSSKSIIKDAKEALHEIYNTKETDMSVKTRQFFCAVSSSLMNVNPDLKWLHIAHSRAGGGLLGLLKG